MVVTPERSDNGMMDKSRLVHHGIKTFSQSLTGNASPRRCDALRKVCGILRDPRLHFAAQ